MTAAEAAQTVLHTRSRTTVEIVCASARDRSRKIHLKVHSAIEEDNKFFAQNVLNTRHF